MLHNYTNFINESATSDKLMKSGKLMNIPMYTRTKVRTTNYSLGEIIKVWDKELQEMIPVIDYLKKGFNFGFLENYTPQSRNKTAFAISHESPNKKYYVGGFGGVWKKQCLIKTK